MILKKVLSINYDKKDCDLLICPHCNSSNFSIFKITSKINEEEHIHIRCIFCDLTYCPEFKVNEVWSNLLG